MAVGAFDCIDRSLFLVAEAELLGVGGASMGGEFAVFAFGSIGGRSAWDVDDADGVAVVASVSFVVTGNLSKTLSSEWFVMCTP